MRGALLLFLLVAGAAQGYGGLLAPTAPAWEQTGLRGVFYGLLGGQAEPLDDLANYSCGGTAPVTTSCERELVAAPGQSYALYINAGTGFTGTVVGTLADSEGRTVGATCTFLAFVGGVSPAPNCQEHGSGGLHAGLLRVVGATPSVNQGEVSAGYWEVRVDIR